MESLAKLRPAFRKDGTITAGNAPGLNSGAAAMIVADARLGREERPQADSRALSPMASRRSSQACSALGPVPAVNQALERAGGSSGHRPHRDQRSLCGHCHAVTRELGLPEDIVNVEGGAIAHGHPIGATGAVLTTRLLHSMQRDGLKRGIVTLCIGGGQGIALALESLR